MFFFLWDLIVLVYILLDIFVLVFRCFFSVNYSCLNSFRTESSVVGFLRASVLLRLVMRWGDGRSVTVSSQASNL